MTRSLELAGNQVGVSPVTTEGLGALVLMTGQTQFKDIYRKAGVILGLDETYTELHLNYAALQHASNPLAAVSQSLRAAANHLNTSHTSDAVVLGTGYGKLGVIASKRFGFKLAVPRWQAFPYTYVQTLLSWQPDERRERNNRRQRAIPHIATPYLRTADFIGLFAD